MLPQVTILAFVVFAIRMTVHWFARKNFAPYAQRSDAIEEWMRQFPRAAQQDINDFLHVFIDGFAIARKHRSKFRPDDRVMDVHRALNPPDWIFGDCAERECFAILLKRRYRIALETIWRDDLTLAEVFAATISVSSANAADRAVR
jgi:hypothetical protein